MLFETTNFTETPQILYNSHYVGIPMAVDVSSGPVKAGSPIAIDGTVQNTADAIGVLLFDVDEKDPNGTVVILGFIREDKLPSPIDNAAKAAMPMIKFLTI